MTNLCFELLDRPVITGGAEDLLFEEPWATRAQVLGEVAALAGALRALGIRPAARVLVALDDPRRAKMAELAVARLGAVVVVTDATSRTAAAAGCVLEIDEDFDWDVALRAGRTDPAEAHTVDPESISSCRWHEDRAIERTLTEDLAEARHQSVWGSATPPGRMEG